MTWVDWSTAKYSSRVLYEQRASGNPPKLQTGTGGEGYRMRGGTSGVVLDAAVGEVEEDLSDLFVIVLSAG